MTVLMAVQNRTGFISESFLNKNLNFSPLIINQKYDTGIYL